MVVLNFIFIKCSNVQMFKCSNWILCIELFELFQPFEPVLLSELELSSDAKTNPKLTF